MSRSRRLLFTLWKFPYQPLPVFVQAKYWRDAVAEHNTSQGDVSWMQRVSPARCYEEQNMEASRTEHDQIMFRSTREITAGEELRVWLDQSLERENGINRCIEDEFEGQCVPIS